MTRPSFDLLDRPWIPVRLLDSSVPEPIGLRELLVRAHEIADIQVPVPPAAAGLWRVLYVLAARISGLSDDSAPATESAGAWQQRRERAWDKHRFDPDKVTEYFAAHPGRFDLFDTERPWLQDPRLASECAKTSGINKLVFGRAAGNSQPWFNHLTDAQAEPVPTEEAVWWLLTQLFYGPSGRCTSRTVAGRTEANSTAGPLRSTISFHPLGASVFHTLLAGLPRPVEDELGETGPDTAPWENAELNDPLGLPQPAGGYAGLLGYFRHAVLLAPSPDSGQVSDAWVTWAWRQPHPPAKDPYLIHQTSQAGNLYARPANAARAVFRDVDALLNATSPQEKATRPEVMSTVQGLPVQELKRLRVRALGFDQDGQTRDRQWFAATTPPVLGLLVEEQEQLRSALAYWRRGAELAGRNLEWALRKVWVAINDPANGDDQGSRKDLKNGPWVARAAAAYWARAETAYWSLVRAKDTSASDWPFFQAALDAYDTVLDLPTPYPSPGRDQPQPSPRLIRAAENHRGLIFANRPRFETPQGGQQ